LRRLDVPVITAREAGLRTSPDRECLEIAERDGLVIVTEDRDFPRLAKDLRNAGVVHIKGGRRSTGKIVEYLRLLHAVVHDDEMKGHIEHL